MSEITAKPESIAPPIWLLLPLAIFTAAGVVGIVALQQWYWPLDTIQAALTLAGLATGAFLLFGPSRAILTVTFLLALLDHQFRSFAILPFAGVEWHPRELLLLLLFAHAAVKIVQHRPTFHWTPLHFGMLLYTAVFVYMAWRGLWLGNAPRDIIAECRAPLFLGAFWVFACTVRAPRELHYYGNLALCVVVLLASATVAAFGYFALTGPVPNTQNALGEFVPRAFAGMSLQSVRPSGHAWLEAALVVSLGMLICPTEPWFRRIIYVALIPLFAAAVAVGMMRTAFISVGVSIAVLAWLNLPRVGKGLVLSLVLGVAATVAGLALLESSVAGAVVARDASLTARAVETEGALQAFRQHPFFGAGLGASFQALGLARTDSESSAIPVAYHTLHNVWLYLAWKGGLVGLGLAVLAMGCLWGYSHRVVKRLPTMSQRCFGRALQAVLAGQLVASVAMPRLTYANGALFLALWTMAFVLLARTAEDRDGKAESGGITASRLECPFPEASV